MARTTAEEFRKAAGASLARETVFGACACVPQPEIADQCTCEIRDLIDRILVTAYHCPPEVAASRMRDLIRDAPAILSDVQDRLMVRLAAEWTGTPEAFAKRHGYTRQRLHQMGVRWRRR